jgi:hypothetical protein
MSYYLQRYGERLGLEVFNTGSFAPLMGVYTDRNSHDPRVSGAASLAWLGAIVEMAKLLEVTQRNGVATITPAPPTMDEVLYAAATDPKRLRDVSDRLVLTIRKMHSAGPGIRASYPAESKAQAAAPLEVRIVGMPDREATTAIERDANGEMSGSHQVEKDG